MLEKILTKMAEKVYPKRNISVEKIGGRLFLHSHDTTGCNDYLLEGTYSYDEVVKLNNLTTYSVGFGFCSELGPIAFIGMPNHVCAQKSGYFKYKVEHSLNRANIISKLILMKKQRILEIILYMVCVDSRKLQL